HRTLDDAVVFLVGVDHDRVVDGVGGDSNVLETATLLRASATESVGAARRVRIGVLGILATGKIIKGCCNRRTGTTRCPERAAVRLAARTCIRTPAGTPTRTCVL